MEINLNNNPFDLTKASDFSDNQILDYFVDLAGNAGLLSLLMPTSVMPMLVLGGKGSGKTHLLRYCSSAVQKLRHPNSFWNGIKQEGYLGIYFRADGLNSGRFEGKGIDQEIWKTVFEYSFENWIVQLTLQPLVELFGSSDELKVVEPLVVTELISLFNKKPEIKLETIADVLSYFVEVQKNIDYQIGNCALTRKLQIEQLYSPGEFIFGIPETLKKVVPEFGDIVFLYSIDELENYLEWQQEYVNTLIRYRRGSATFRIGARLYGIKTVHTSRAGEPIKKGAEYDEIWLDAMIRSSAGYSDFAKTLCVKRLKEAKIFNTGVDTGYLTKTLDQYFEVINPENFYQEATLKVVSKYSNEDRPYFQKLRDRLLALGKVSATDISQIIHNLLVRDFPLLEKLNILLLYKDWGKARALIDASQAIKSTCAEFLKDQKSQPGYGQLLGHFKSDLLAQLYRDCSRRPIYAGLDTFIHMSQGVPRNFLGLLKQIYKRSVFNGETPFQNDKISIESQQEGVRDGAVWFLEDSQPDSHGPEVRSSIESIAELLRAVRFSDKPSECALSTFSVNASLMSQSAREILKHSENWLFLIKIRDGAKEKHTKAIIEKFQVNPILSPRWDISETRRGALSLTPELGNSIFDPSCRGSFRRLLRERVAGMNAPFFGKNKQQTQGTDLFGFDSDD